MSLALVATRCPHAAVVLKRPPAHRAASILLSSYSPSWSFIRCCSSLMVACRSPGPARLRFVGDQLVVTREWPVSVDTRCFRALNHWIGRSRSREVSLDKGIQRFRQCQHFSYGLQYNNLFRVVLFENCLQVRKNSEDVLFWSRLPYLPGDKKTMHVVQGVLELAQVTGALKQKSPRSTEGKLCEKAGCHHHRRLHRLWWWPALTPLWGGSAIVLRSPSGAIFAKHSSSSVVLRCSPLPLPSPSFDSWVLISLALDDEGKWTTLGSPYLRAFPGTRASGRSSPSLDFMITSLSPSPSALRSRALGISVLGQIIDSSGDAGPFSDQRLLCVAPRETDRPFAAVWWWVLPVRSTSPNQKTNCFAHRSDRQCDLSWPRDSQTLTWSKHAAQLPDSTRRVSVRNRFYPGRSSAPQHVASAKTAVWSQTWSFSVSGHECGIRPRLLPKAGRPWNPPMAFKD